MARHGGHGGESDPLGKPGGSRRGPSEIVARARGGDPEAQATLAANALPRLTVSLRTYGADPELAADLAQEALAVALDRIETLRGDDETAFRSWTIGIGRRLLARERRARGRLPTVSLDVPGATGGEQARQDPLGQGAMATRTRVRRVLARLPADVRELLLARWVDEEPVESAAARTGISAAAMRKRLARAARRFREVYDNEQEGEHE